MRFFPVSVWENKVNFERRILCLLLRKNMMSAWLEQDMQAVKQLLPVPDLGWKRFCLQSAWRVLHLCPVIQILAEVPKDIW